MTASAHEDDTHYLLTYVICRSVGFTHDEALYVAACNVAMDDTDNLVACGSAPGGESGIQAHVDNEWMWHAIAPCNGAGDVLQKTRDILKQKDLLYQLALDKWTVLGLDTDLVQSWKPTPSPQNVRLFWLGVFFHYQQDTWAHRRPKRGVNSRREWESYSSPNGHVGIMDGLDTAHEQDRPPWNPMTAPQKSRRWNHLRQDFPSDRPGSAAQPVLHQRSTRHAWLPHGDRSMDGSKGSNLAEKEPSLQSNLPRGQDGRRQVSGGTDPRSNRRLHERDDDIGDLHGR